MKAAGGNIGEFKQQSVRGTVMQTQQHELLFSLIFNVEAHRTTLCG